MSLGPPGLGQQAGPGCSGPLGLQPRMGEKIFFILNSQTEGNCVKLINVIRGCPRPVSIELKAFRSEYVYEDMLLLELKKLGLTLTYYSSRVKNIN